MKHMNELLREVIERIDEKSRKHDKSLARERGIAQLRKTMGMDEKPKRPANHKICQWHRQRIDFHRTSLKKLTGS